MFNKFFRKFGKLQLIVTITLFAMALQAAALPPTPPNKLTGGQTLHPGDYLQSWPNGEVQLHMQTDGNLVLYKTSDFTPLWNSSSWGNPGARADMQTDGNLVVYGPDNRVLFHTNTYDNKGAWLELQADRNLVVYSAAGKALWASETPVDLEDPDDDEPLPLIPGTGIPSDDQGACKQDADYFQVDGTSNVNALVNRHVLCVRKRISRTVDVRDPSGILRHNAGVVTLDAGWSVHGIHTQLSKTGTLVLRYNYTKIQDVAAPPLKVIAKISCSTQGGGPAVQCDQAMPLMTLTHGEQSRGEIAIPFTWDQSYKIVNAAINVRLLYTYDGSLPVDTSDGSGGTEREDPGFGAWPIRCDVDQLRKGWKGCVFAQAPAVWVVDGSPLIERARQHIAYVFSNLPTVPGRYQLVPGTRSEPEKEGQFDPLTRADIPTRKLNRKATKDRCGAMPPVGPPNCPATEKCDCDEYPPASAIEGAHGKPLSLFSVRKILYSDNRKAGAQLGAMYARERVLVGDKYRILIPKEASQTQAGWQQPTQE